MSEDDALELRALECALSDARETGPGWLVDELVVRIEGRRKQDHSRQSLLAELSQHTKRHFVTAALANGMDRTIDEMMKRDEYGMPRSLYEERAREVVREEMVRLLSRPRTSTPLLPGDVRS